jgi:hypothetical protein
VEVGEFESGGEGAVGVGGGVLGEVLGGVPVVFLDGAGERGVEADADPLRWSVGLEDSPAAAALRAGHRRRGMPSLPGGRSVGGAARCGEDAATYLPFALAQASLSVTLRLKTGCGAAVERESRMK